MLPEIGIDLVRNERCQPKEALVPETGWMSQPDLVVIGQTKFRGGPTSIPHSPSNWPLIRPFGGDWLAETRSPADFGTGT